jgi:pimeloyl-ACP methyl ester carboxylesterase
MQHDSRGSEAAPEAGAGAVDALRELELSYLRRIEAERRRVEALLHGIIPLGVALSVEKDFNQLLERIVIEAQELCRADGGTLYLREQEQLRFVIARNRSLKLAMGGVTGKDIPFAPLRLYDEQSGAPLFNYVVTHAALESKTILIADAYAAEGYDFSGTREFDARTGYRTTSVLNIPLKDGLDQVIGVLQLINALDEQGQVTSFDPLVAQMLESLGALAASALSAYVREQQLREEIAELRIEIDQARKQREVAAITSTPYFTELQEKARAMRGAASGPTPRRATTVERRVLSVSGQTVVVREQGPARGRMLLLIHGWSSSWYALSPLMRQLSERYRCVAVDLPGFGESPPLAGRASIPAYADLMGALIEQLSPGLSAIVIGHSMGGMIALTMAIRRHEQIERMVLLCPTISGRLSFWINAFVSPITMLERSTLAGKILAHLEPYMLRVTDGLMRPASFAERSEIAEADYQRLRADARRPGQGRVRAECFGAMREHDLSERLGEMSVPTLVIWGMEDNTVPLRDASLVVDKLPMAQLRVLPKAGHWPQFETPEATRRHIRAFLSTPLKLLKSDL